MGKKSISVFWFRRDLRLEDNRALYHALNSDYPVLPIFIFDKNILDDLVADDDPRLTFIHDHLSQIHQDLKEKGTGLKSFYGSPKESFEELLEEYDVKEIYSNEDYEPYALDRDKEIAELAALRSVSFHQFKDQVIFAKDEVVKDDLKPYLVYTPYSKKWMANLKKEDLEEYSSALRFNNWLQDATTGIIDLNEMGFSRSTIQFPKKDVKAELLRKYSEERDLPFKDSTSKLGVHLRFGTTSIRKLVKFATEHSETFLKELIWREFFMMILYHFPKVVDRNFNAKYDSLQWRNSEADFEKWKKGRTGFALVDAGMRQLNQTGFMHNRVRMLVASFLTKHLLIDWKWGEAYFAEKLLDYELASNNGNWQWAAGTGVDAQPYFRVFNPDSQQQKFDPKESYINTWIPEYGSSRYPEKMVDHKEARERAIAAFKEAASN